MLVILILTLFLSIVGSALDQEVDLTLQYVADLLEETLPMMKNVIFILDEGEAKHKEDAWGAAQSLLTLLRG